MGDKEVGEKDNKKRERFTLELGDDIVGRFLLQLPQEKRPGFARRLLEEMVLSGEAYDIADDYDFEVVNPKGRSRRRPTRSGLPANTRMGNDAFPRSGATMQKEEVAAPVLRAVNADSKKVNTSGASPMHSVAVQHDDDRVQNPASERPEQALADEMREAQIEVERARQDTLAATGAASTTDRLHANGARNLASHGGGTGGKATESPKAGAAQEPELQQKVPPKLKLTGFFGEKPRSIRSSQSPASHESPTSSGESR